MSHDDDNDHDEIPWILEPAEVSSRALAALAKAVRFAHDFDSGFELYNSERELGVPHFHPEELIIVDQPLRYNSFQAEYQLSEICFDKDGSFSEKKEHFAARSEDGFYSVKYLQDGIAEQSYGEAALLEMVRETKILMSIAPHPHLSAIYGITSRGIDALVDPGRNGFFYITDRITETLEDRMGDWEKSCGTVPSITDRLMTALDIVSALVYLHDRKLVYFVRPDKVGFDARNDQIKLFDFGQAHQHGTKEHSRQLTGSDNMRVLAYTAPEVFSSSPVNRGSDVYSFAVMLWEIVTLEKAFDGFDRAMHFQQVVRSGFRPLAVDESWDKDIANVITSCWNPHRRPKMKKLHCTLETVLLLNDVKEPNRRRAKTKRQTSVDTMSLSESEDNDPVISSTRSATEELNGLEEHLELDTLPAHSSAEKKQVRSGGSACSKDGHSAQSRASQRSDCSECSGEENKQPRQSSGSVLLTSKYDTKMSTQTPSAQVEASETGAGEHLTVPGRREATVEPAQSHNLPETIRDSPVSQNRDARGKRRDHKLQRSASCSSVMVDPPATLRSRCLSNSSHSACSHHRSKSSEQNRRTPKASKSAPDVFASPEKRKRSSSRSAPRRSSSGKERHHEPRTPSSRSSSKSPSGRRSPSERAGTPKLRRSSSGKHPHGRRDSSKSPSNPTETARKHEHRKRSSSRGSSDQKKKNILMEELEQFLVLNGAKLPTTPGGTTMKPKIIVRKPVVSGRPSRQKSSTEIENVFPFSADPFFESALDEEFFPTLSRVPPDQSADATDEIFVEPSDGPEKCQLPTRTDSDQSEVRRPRKANLLDDIKGNASFNGPDTPPVQRTKSSAALKQLQTVITLSTDTTQTASLQSPKKRAMGGNFLGSQERSTPETPKLATPLRTRRSSLIMGLVAEHKQNRAKPGSSQFPDT